MLIVTALLTLVFKSGSTATTILMAVAGDSRAREIQVG
jgi:hypothetical protein